jgi:hypothetical protein
VTSQVDWLTTTERVITFQHTKLGDTQMSVRQWRFAAVGLAVGAVVVTAVAALAPSSAKALDIVVYKSPTCGCCTKWIDHLQANGFNVTAHDTNDLLSIKSQYGITSDVESCHTAVIDGYVVEGHVPADVIKRLVAERPEIVGIAVPGMPMGSPGMEGPRTDHYDVVAFDRAGNRSVYDRR